MQTSKTLVIDGTEAKRASTTNFMPSFREIILSGRKALKALKAFKPCKLDEFAESALAKIGDKSSMRETVTTKKSKMFHVECK